ARDVLRGAHRREADRDARRSVGLRFEAYLGSRLPELLAQPRYGPRPLRFGGDRRPGVALEKREIRAVSADRDRDGEATGVSGFGQRAADQRRLAVAPRRNQEHLLAY